MIFLKLQVLIAKGEKKEALPMLAEIQPRFAELHGADSEVCTNILAAIKMISK